MRWLITGAGGMLGRDLQAVLAALSDSSRSSGSHRLSGSSLFSGAAGHEVVAATRAQLDVTDFDAVREAVDGVDVVLNAAAWTDVDGAETSEEAATAINGHGARNLALAAGKRLIHVSTDYVFDGTATTPIPEDAARAPLNAYGRSKAVGEEAVLAAGGSVVRTAWLYGEHGPNFVKTMLRLAGERDTLDVVDDQVGPPTWSYALAEQLVALGRSGAAPGVYHGTAAGSTTWFGLARAVFEEAGLDPARVRPTTSDRFVRPARRPPYSVLGHDGWAGSGVAPLPDWRPMLADFCRVAVTPGT